MADLFNLGGDVALVTGSTRGIGKAMTMALAEAGADLLLMVRSKPDPAMIKTIHALGRSVDIYECDLEKQDQVGTVVAEILKMHRVTIFVNACGIQRRAAAIEQTDEIFREIMQVNLNAPFAITREVGRAWIAQGIAGRIVLVSSLAAFQGGVRMTSYAASKGGVAMLTKALSNEWAATGIRVNAIAPGYIETDMNLDTRTNPDQTHADSISQRIPAGRWGVPEDLKAVTIFLASRSATTYITGETIAVDGGWLAR